MHKKQTDAFQQLMEGGIHKKIHACKKQCHAATHGHSSVRMSSTSLSARCPSPTANVPSTDGHGSAATGVDAAELSPVELEDAAFVSDVVGVVFIRFMSKMLIMSSSDKHRARSFRRLFLRCAAFKSLATRWRSSRSLCV